MNNPFDKIGHDTHAKIISYLDSQSLSNFASVSKKDRNLVYKEKLQRIKNNFSQQTYYESFLNYLVVCGQVAHVQAFLESNKDIDQIDLTGQTLLHYAVYHDRLDIVEFLLEKNANRYNKDKEGSNSLHCAASQCNADAMQLLFENDTQAFTAQLLTTDGNMMTILHLIAQSDKDADTKTAAINCVLTPAYTFMEDADYQELLKAKNDRDQTAFDIFSERSLFPGSEEALHEWKDVNYSREDWEKGNDDYGSDGGQAAYYESLREEEEDYKNESDGKESSSEEEPILKRAKHQNDSSNEGFSPKPF